MPTKGFRFSSGDVNPLDYGAVWMRRIGDKRYHFIELVNMEDACGRDNEGCPRYYVNLSEVDLDSVPSLELARAFTSCGWEGADLDDAATVAEIVRSYGVAAPLHEETSNNAHKAIAACRKESYRLTRDALAYELAMSRPVNAIGSTAREFGRGDINSAIIRGVKEGNRDAGIMAKMYIAAEGRTLGGSIPESELKEMREALDDRLFQSWKP